MRYKSRSLREKGITLVALVVTIIVLLILAGVTISLALGSNGLISITKDAKKISDSSQMAEEIQMIAMEVGIQGNGTINNNEFRLKLKNNISTIKDNDIVGDNNEGWKVRINNKYIYISPDGNVKEVLDRTGINEGDYVSYTDGDWKEEEIEELGNLYLGENIPTSSNPYTFGGFKVGQSKDIGIIKGNENESIKDLAHSGWRVLKVNNDASINLIHAGAPEWYYHPTRYNVSGSDSMKLRGSVYRSYYILNGIKADEDYAFAYEGVEKRKWNVYENNKYVKKDSCRLVQTDEVKGASTAPNFAWYRIIGANFWVPTITFAYLGGITWCDYRENGSASLNMYGRSATAGIRLVLTLKPECILENVNEENIATHNTQDTAWNLKIP